MKKANKIAIFLSLLFFPPILCQGGKIIKKPQDQECLLKRQIASPVYVGKGVYPGKIKEEKNVPLKKLVEHSDLIVVGKVISMNHPTLQMGNFKGAPSGFSPCTIAVDKVLKGYKDIKFVTIAMPMSSTIGKFFIRWDGPIYGCDLEGVWFLNKKPINVPLKIIEYVNSKGDYFFANTRERFKKADENLIGKISSIIRVNSHKQSVSGR